MALINTLQWAARKHLIQMSLITVVTVIPDCQGTYQQLVTLRLCEGHLKTCSEESSIMFGS
jgi:hypothetical protein